MSESPLAALSLVACTCTASMECASTAAGHGMHLMQQRLVRATPGKWIDAIVGSVDSDGRVTIIGLDGSRSVLWHHSTLADAVTVGEPVALHGVYHVLAIGDTRFNVAVS